MANEDEQSELTGKADEYHVKIDIPVPVLNDHFNAGFQAGVEAIQQSLDGLRRIKDYSAHPATRGAQIDEQFVRETVQWAKEEWPMLRDAVQARLQEHQQPAESITGAFTGLLMVRLIDFIEKAGVADIAKELQRAMQTIEFYSEQFATMLQGSGLLTGEQHELPPLGQGLAALQHLMVYKEQIEANELREAAEVQLWADAANMMNERLVGQPEQNLAGLSLLERFTMYLERIIPEPWPPAPPV